MKRHRRSEQRVSVVDQVARVAQESVHRIKQIPGHLLHPSIIRCNTDPGNVHCAGLHLDDEEDPVADRSEHAQNLDAEEVAGIQRVPKWLLRNCFQVRLRFRFGAGSIPTSAIMSATIAHPISIFSPRNASRILV